MKLVVQHLKYNPDKSNICLEQNQANQAMNIFDDITIQNQTKARKLCPRPCQQYIIGFSNKEISWSNSIRPPTLRMEFPKYIRVSSSSYSYTLLELLAEVGGYVGLFLGVSINQISDLLTILATKIFIFNN